MEDKKWRKETVYWSEECIRARRSAKEWKRIAKLLVEANYEQDGQMMDRAVAECQEAEQGDK